jgi:hypothetical protein
MKHILLGGLIALLLTGCGKLNRENYDKLKMGISYAEASSILGKAERCDDALGTTSCIWGGEARTSRSVSSPTRRPSSARKGSTFFPSLADAQQKSAVWRFLLLVIRAIWPGTGAINGWRTDS